jgi:hypothetical protein
MLGCRVVGMCTPEADWTVGHVFDLDSQAQACGVGFDYCTESSVSLRDQVLGVRGFDVCTPVADLTAVNQTLFYVGIAWRHTLAPCVKAQP